MTLAEAQRRGLAGAWLARADDAWLALSPARRSLVGWLLLAVATMPVLSRQIIGQTGGDVRIYFRVADAFFQGGRVYREVAFEYPVYALLWCLPPRLFSHDLESYRLAFGLEMWMFDAAIKAALVWYGVRARQGIRDLLPCVVYSLGSGALGHVLLQRYDLVPAAISLVAVLAAAGGWPLAGGALIALGGGTKLYPAMLFPVLAAIEWRRGGRQFRRYVAGAVLAAAPALLAAVWMPWWRFASPHVGRGLQVESLPASLIWALHFAGLPATWVSVTVTNSNEVSGPVAAAVVGPARLVWAVATLGAVAAATVAAWRLDWSRGSAAPAVQMPRIAALSLLPIAAFVSTNIVLSPQFMLWLIPLAALVLFAPPSGSSSDPGSSAVPPTARRAAWCILVATLLVPTFFPSREYPTGFGLWRTGLLLLRNGVLIYATVCLWMAARVMRRGRDRASVGDQADLKVRLYGGAETL